MAQLTDTERQERKLKRQATRNWRRQLCVEIANDAVAANKAADPGNRNELSTSFLALIRKFIK